MARGFTPYIDTVFECNHPYIGTLLYKSTTLISSPRKSPPPPLPRLQEQAHQAGVVPFPMERVCMSKLSAMNLYFASGSVVDVRFRKSCKVVSGVSQFSTGIE